MYKSLLLFIATLLISRCGDISNQRLIPNGSLNPEIRNEVSSACEYLYQIEPTQSITIYSTSNGQNYSLDPTTQPIPFLTLYNANLSYCSVSYNKFTQTLSIFDNYFCTQQPGSLSNQVSCIGQTFTLNLITRIKTFGSQAPSTPSNSNMFY